MQPAQQQATQLPRPPSQSAMMTPGIPQPLDPMYGRQQQPPQQQQYIMGRQPAAQPQIVQVVNSMGAAPQPTPPQAQYQPPPPPQYQQPAQPQYAAAQPPQSAPTSTPAPTAGTVNEQEKRKLIQQQLILLLHAHKCGSNATATERPCNVPHCATMRDVLAHMSQCQDGRACTKPHCASSRQIIAHWKNCQKVDCPVCSPLRNNSAAAANPVATVQPQPGMISRTNSNPAVSSDGAVSTAATAVAATPVSLMDKQPDMPRQSKPWHAKITTDMRRHLIQKIVHTMFPTHDPKIYNDNRLGNLFNYAVRIEGEMYDAAQDSENYFHLLAERIYRIQREFEEKQRRQQQQQQRVLATNGTDAATAAVTQSNSATNHSDFQTQLNQLDVYNSGKWSSPRPARYSPLATNTFAYALEICNLNQSGCFGD